MKVRSCRDNFVIILKTNDHDNKISYAMASLLGLGMIFLGARFFFAPDAATAGFGIRFDARGDYSFHHIKGIRDVFSGILLCGFVLMNQRQAVGLALLAGSIIPVNDMLVVLSKPYNGLAQAMAHIIAIVICAVFGALLLATSSQSIAKSSSNEPDILKS